MLYRATGTPVVDSSGSPEFRISGGRWGNANNSTDFCTGTMFFHYARSSTKKTLVSWQSLGNSVSYDGHTFVTGMAYSLLAPAVNSGFRIQAGTGYLRGKTNDYIKVTGLN